MKVLLQQAHIIDPSSPHHRTVNDIFIESGIISKIASSIDEPADQVISGKYLHVSPGWLDLFAHFADPGYEHKETLETGAAAAAAGGFGLKKLRNIQFFGWFLNPGALFY